MALLVMEVAVEPLAIQAMLEQQAMLVLTAQLVMQDQAEQLAVKVEQALRYLYLRQTLLVMCFLLRAVRAVLVRVPMVHLD
jgi:hypothetical protein